MTERDRRNRIHARTVWISDVHLGFRGCSAELLLDFLRRIECERLYLVGDIIDIWSMKRRPYWPQSHNNVVRTILGLGTRTCARRYSVRWRWIGRPAWPTRARTRGARPPPPS